MLMLACGEGEGRGADVIGGGGVGVPHGGNVIKPTTERKRNGGQLSQPPNNKSSGDQRET